VTGPEQPWDDGLHDLLGLVAAARQEDTAGVYAVLKHGDALSMLSVAVVLLNQVLEEQRVPDGHFRLWAAAHAAPRGGQR
jgi:hypothetical protein